ncbi:aminoimidazole riboside kinase [Zobellella endophytica]|uniref:Aminoimidazole riboside kinase n=1 Tax=Zobellella endophytica TaxID=2116700 RepID=A0A2P7R5Y0_9GAMM|nr:aminoimidazole riboside kinase [Zobellella endophytica]PSJ45618.1 aminoimidazole riboside kinase [Zobellella endophytica]
MPVVYCLGDGVMDLLPAAAGQLRPCVGGAPANVAVGVRRLGGEAAFVGRLGQDPFGDDIIAALNAEGVCTRHAARDPRLPTSATLVTLGDGGERSFFFLARSSADQLLEPADLPVFRTGDWLHLCSLALTAEPARGTALMAVRRIRQAGGFVSFDANIRLSRWPDRATLKASLERIIPEVDLLKLSQEEAELLTGHADPHLAMTVLEAEYRRPLMLISLGSAGVLASRQGERVHQGAFAVRAVDTTGAGDAFMAGLLAGLAQNPEPGVAQLSRLLRQAQACGAQCCLQPGAMAALPDGAALNDFINQQN